METLPIPEDRKQGKLEFEPSKNINICDDCKNIYNKCNTDGMITEQDEDDNTIKCNYYEAQAEQEEQGL